MVWYVLRLSLDYGHIALSELNAVIEAENIDVKNMVRIDEFVLLDISENELRILQKRLALTKEYGLLLDVVREDDIEQILQLIKEFRSSDAAVCVSIDCVRGFGKNIVDRIYDNVKPFLCASSTLRDNVKQMRIAFVAGNALIYLISKIRRMSEYIDREPHRRPVYKPGAMKPMLARAYVNLSRVRSGEVLLDPFCGVGSFAIEACLMGINTVCIDVDENMCYAAKKNIGFYGCTTFTEIIRADSTYQDIRSLSVDAIATDPPYGRQSAPRGKDLTKLLIEFLNTMSNILKRNRYAVFAVPHNISMYIKSEIKDLSMEIVEVLYDWVHGGLTRVLYVVKSC